MFTLFGTICKLTHFLIGIYPSKCVQTDYSPSRLPSTFHLIAPTHCISISPLLTQILAINRAVEKDIISLKITVSPRVLVECRALMAAKYLPTVHRAHWDLVYTAFADAWKRLIEPHLASLIR